MDVDRARSLQAGHPGASVNADWQALIERDDIDAVIISTPPPAHAEMCVAALGWNKHVLCEKPLAATPDEARRMVEAANARGRILATGFNYRFYPAFSKARELLDSGLIGDLDHIRSYAGHPGGSEFTHAWVHDVAVTGGGALLDNGIHIVDLTRYFLGEVVEVAGYATGNVWGFPGCEDNGFALLKGANGAVASLQASWSEWRGYRLRVELYGTRGCIVASYPPMLTFAVWAGAPGGRRRRRIFPFAGYQVKERIHSYRWTGRESFARELRAFAAAMAGGPHAALATGFDGLRAIEIVHAVYDSSRRGVPVRSS